MKSEQQWAACMFVKECTRRLKILSDVFDKNPPTAWQREIPEGTGFGRYFLLCLGSLYC